MLRVTNRANSEDDFKRMLGNPINMRNKWRARLRRSADALAKEKSPERRKKMELMFHKQKLKLAEWEQKAKA